MITSKTKMYSHLSKGLFGNAMRIYHTMNSIPETGRYAIRYKLICSMRKCLPGATKNTIRKLDFSEIIVSDKPEEQSSKVMNGELTRYIYGLELNYKIGNMWMRPALENPDRATGLKAKLILQHYLDATSYDCLMELLELYPDHVIEFTVMEKTTGIWKRNTMVWEVRKY